MPGHDVVRRWRPSAPRYRTMDEARILRLLLLSGWAFEVRCHGTRPYLGAASDALERLISLGLPFRPAAGRARLFDPVEVVNFVKWTGLSDQDAFWRERFVATGRRLVREARSAAPTGGALANLSGPRRFTILLRRRINLATQRPGAPLRLRLPLPVENAALHDLRTEAWHSGATDLALSILPGRVEARGAWAGEGEIVLTARCSFTARMTGPPTSTSLLDVAERSLFLQPDEGMIRVTERVRSVADHLAGGCRDPWQTVERFRRFMFECLACGMVHYDEIRAARAATDWVLEEGWFDCHVGSALLAALCRARGLPARLSGGYLLYEVAPTQHYWVDVWMDDRGWTPFDLLAWDLSTAGQDSRWRDVFAGHLDHRMLTQRMPRIFTGPMSVRLPPAWHMVSQITEDGAATEFSDIASGTFIYEDALSVAEDDR